MNKIIFTLLIIFCFSVMAKNMTKEAPFYGTDITAKEAIKLDEVLKNYKRYEGKDVVIEANVEKVCVHKGCWMTLQGSNDTFRVKFHDYSFFVPMSLKGKKVWVNGEVLRKTLSIAQTKHYLKDAGASKEEIAAINEPSFEYRIMAKGVKVVK